MSTPHSPAGSPPRRGRTRVAVVLLSAVALAGSLATAHAVKVSSETPSPHVHALLPTSDPIDLDTNRPAHNLRTDKGIPDTCAVAVTGVNPEGNLLIHAMKGMKHNPYSFNVKVPFTPKAITFYTEKVEAKKATRTFFAINPEGRLKRLVVTEEFDESGRTQSSLDVVDVSKGWGGIRELNSSRPFLYALDTDGKMRRYGVSDEFAIKGPTMLGGATFGAMSTLSTGQVFSMGKDSKDKPIYADSFIARTSKGGLQQVLVTKNEGKVVVNNLQDKGWATYQRVVTGQCVAGKGAPLLGIDKDGVAFGFFKADAGNGKGTDIASLGKVATGWVGRLGD